MAKKKLSDLDRELLSAVEQGQEREVERLLGAGADPNARFRKRSALDRVPHPGHLIKCLLIEAGARAPMLKKWMVWAAQRKRPATVKALIEYGADLNQSAPSGTPLVVAVASGCRETVELLLQAGADVNAAAGFSTPLSQAIEGGRPDLLALLLEAGASPEQKPKYGGSPALFLAIEGDRSQCLDLLLEAGADCEVRATANSLEHASETLPVHLAAALGKASLLARLIEAGGNPNSRDGRGFTAFDWAREKNFSRVHKALAEAGAIELKDNPNQALFKACESGDLAQVKDALEAGAELECRDAREATKNFTPLLVATSSNRTEVSRYLLEAGAQLNVREDSPKVPSFVLGEMGDPGELGYLPNRSPLQWALHHGNLELAELFLERGAEVSDKDNFGQTPMMAAAVLDSVEVLELLRSRGAKPDKAGGRRTTPLMLASEKGCLRAARWLLQNKAKPDRKNSDGQTPLSLACGEVNKEMMELLLEAGADVNKVNGMGQTPLSAVTGAVRSVPYKAGQKSLGAISYSATGATTLAPYPEAQVLELVELLLAKGANANPKGVDWPPLLNAAQANQPRVIERLLQAGANPNTRGVLGETALEMAKLYQNQEALAVLNKVAKGHPKPAKKKKPKFQPKARMIDVPDFTKALDTPEFQDAVTRLGDLCGSRPVLEDNWAQCHVDSARVEKLNTADTQAEFLQGGWFLFESSGSIQAPAKFCMIPSKRWQDALAVLQTNGINCDVGTMDIIEWLEALQKSHPFTLLTVAHDLVAGRFQGPVKKPKTLAKSMYEICPDTVEQGCGTVDELAKELKKSRTFFMWWD